MGEFVSHYHALRKSLRPLRSQRLKFLPQRPQRKYTQRFAKVLYLTTEIFKPYGF